MSGDTQELRIAIGIMTPDDVAALLGVTKHTLSMWRAAGKGPAHAKLGRSIFYRKTDVDEWIASSVVKPADEAA